MTIKAEIVLDSVNPQGIRFTTMKLRFPRFILAEFSKHRVFSFNTSSSRAIPVAKLIEDIKTDPAIPLHWGLNQKGMQAYTELSEAAQDEVLSEWNAHREASIKAVESLSKLGLHKQVANRLIETHGHVNVICSGTHWANFYHLRRHVDAQPEIHALADAMYEAQIASNPIALAAGDWHLPLISESDRQTHKNRDLVKISVARCARTSYMTMEGKLSTLSDDLALYDKLVGASPIHASPAEHQATPTGDSKNCGNLKGWIQWRKFLEVEFIDDYFVR